MSKSVFLHCDCFFFFLPSALILWTKMSFNTRNQRKQQKSNNNNLAHSEEVFWKIRYSLESTVGHFMRMVHYFLLGIVVSTGSLPWKLSKTCDVTKFNFLFFKPSLAEESHQHLGGIRRGGRALFFSFFETGNMLNKLLPLPRSSNHRRRTVELTAQ